MTKQRGLLIFAREPLPGTVKSRLAIDTGPELAHKLYVGMLNDVLAKAASLQNISIMVFWASDSGIIPPCPGLPESTMFVQHGSTLGERMAEAFKIAFSSGIETCCIIGTDSPDLPPEYIQQAFHLLEQNDVDVVFGPAEDGGYYLVGIKRLWSELFKGIPWSSSSVLSDSIARADKLKLKNALLPLWYDIDTLSDLQRLRLSQPSTAPHTHQVINLMNIFSSLQQKDALI